MTGITIAALAGTVAENKDVARDIRVGRLLPALSQREEVVLDFMGVRLATQSFIQALISDAMRIHGVDVLDRLLFRNCNESIQALISIVVDYMQAAHEGPSEALRNGSQRT
jgi:hypothetical protein